MSILSKRQARRLVEDIKVEISRREGLARATASPMYVAPPEPRLADDRERVEAALTHILGGEPTDRHSDEILRVACYYGVKL